MPTIETIVANQIVHREHVQKVLERTGGEIMAPDHYDLREAIRVAVLNAIDEATDEQGMPKMSDGELPTLFRTLDAVTERVWIKSL